MKLKEYLDERKITIQQASLELNCAYEEVRRYVIGAVIPRAKRMKSIVTWSKGAVTANDFYGINKEGE